MNRRGFLRGIAGATASASTAVVVPFDNIFRADQAARQLATVWLPEIAPSIVINGNTITGNRHQGFLLGNA